MKRKKYDYVVILLSVVSRARPFTDSCPPGRKGLVTCAHTFGDFPHDSWGTVLPSVLLVGSCVFLHFRNLLAHKLNVCE